MVVALQACGTSAGFGPLKVSRKALSSLIVRADCWLQRDLDQARIVHESNDYGVSTHCKLPTLYPLAN